MEDQFQHQLAQLVKLFHEKRTTNLARQEAINARLDALAEDLENSNVDFDSNENTNLNVVGREKNKVVGGSGREF